jgi:hypothetical protein
MWRREVANRRFIGMSPLTSNPLGMTPSDIAQFVADCRILIANSKTLYEVRDALSKAVVLIESNAHETGESAAELAFYRASMPESLRWDRVDSNVKEAWRQHTLKAGVVPDASI